MRDKFGRIEASVDDYAIAFRACEQGMKSLASPEVKPEVVRFVETLETMLATQVAVAKKALADWEAGKAASERVMAEWRSQRAARGSGAEKVSNMPPKFEDPMPVVPTVVKASYEQIRRGMGVGSIATVKNRATDAFAAEVVERVDATPTGRGRPSSEWRIKISAAQLTSQAEAVEVLPPVEKLRGALAAQSAPKE